MCGMIVYEEVQNFVCIAEESDFHFVPHMLSADQNSFPGGFVIFVHLGYMYKLVSFEKRNLVISTNEFTVSKRE